MQYKILETQEIYIVGVKEQANFTSNGLVTSQLARQFMPRLKEIKSRKDNYTLSLQNYTNFNFAAFSPNHFFEKWIGVEVNNLDEVPNGMEMLTIAAGKYLVLDFKGAIPQFIGFWQNIHSTWLPNSEFELDSRPHFERLPKSYSPLNQINEEEVWIPIK